MVAQITKRILDKIKRQEHVPCRYIHDHSCHWNAFKKFVICFPMAVKFYFFIHFIPTIVFKREEMLKKAKKILITCVKDIIRSASFISVYIAAFQFFCCLSRNTRRKTDKWNVIYASFLCSTSVLIEHSRRRTELALYFFPRFLESLYNYLLKKKVFQHI